MDEIESIDRHRDAFFARFATKPSPELSAAVRLVSRFNRQGHVCVSLPDLRAEEVAEVWPGVASHPADWTAKLRQSGMVGEPGEYQPLILDKAGRLYFHRYWRYERQVASELLGRAKSEALKFDKTKLNKWLKYFFTPETELQQLAAFMAVTRRLCVISGAPGTGKTRTVVLAVALLIALANEPLRFALAAPTGKAASRLKETIAQCKAELNLPEEIASQIPAEAFTLQRLLGARSDSVHFNHDADHPLPADVVVVDEASMVDLALLAKLLAAVKPQSRLIFIGDQDQLASVEAGSVFRDICSPGDDLPISQPVAHAFEAVAGIRLLEATARRAPIHDCVVKLRKNYRFKEGDGIGELSRAINRGDAAAASRILEGKGAVTWRTLPKNLDEELRSRLLPHFARLAEKSDPAAALRELGNFAVICALRRGPYGADAVNRLFEEMLRAAGHDRFFHGRPLIILTNDYEADLFNGDLGIVLRDEKQVLRAFFPGQDGIPRAFALSRLPPHASAFAMTVHKSQGSEFRRAVLILPNRDAPVLTRELIYTGVTRVREELEIWATRDVFGPAIERTVRRGSGLTEELWSGSEASKT